MGLFNGKLKAQLREVRAKMRELRDKAMKSDDLAELRAIDAQMDDLRIQADDLEDRMSDVDSPGFEQRSPVGRTQILATYSIGTDRPNGTANIGMRSDKQMEIPKDLLEKYEQRGADLKARKVVTFDMDEMELRTVTIGGGTLVVPKHASPVLSPAFNQVSSLIDVVNAVNLPGGESYKKGFVVGYGEGGYTTETDNYTDAEPTMDYVDIGKAKITAYAEMSDESTKLPNVNYQAEVLQAVRVALRKKVGRQIVVGLGGANQIMGIFNAPVNVIPVASDIEIAAIDANTLDTIVFGHGGDEDVEADAYLILNKTDLAAFAALRSADGSKRLYTIKKNGNTGTISSDDSFEVKFIINSACPALSAVGTAAGTYCMAYGFPGVAYELPLFSPLTVEESRDYKFKSGQIAYRGSIWVGGNVAQYKGFTRIKKS